MKYINTNDLITVLMREDLLSDGYLKIINELSEEREEGNKLNEAIELIQYFIDRVDEGSIRSKTTYAKCKQFLDSLQQPTPLKVAIKGDCTYDYSKKIFQYFKSHTIKGQHDVDSFLEDVYYYIEKGNIVFFPFLPESYTEISLKEDWKIVTDNSKVNTYLLKRVEELEKELIDLKLKLKQNVLLEEDGKTLNKELEEVMSDRDDLAKRFIEFKDRENVILEASVKEMENRKRVLINKILDFNNQYKNSTSTIQDFKNGVHKACAQIINLVEKM